MEFFIRLANINIRICSIYDIVDDSIKQYIVHDVKKPDIEILVTESLLLEEFKKLQAFDEDVLRFSDIEKIFIQRTIAELLPGFHAFLFHGAAIARDNATHIFTGKSGTGKTTHIMQWLDKTDNTYVVNGDKPYILITPEGPFACGTPWCGKENLGSNAMVPLRSIVFMERNIENRIEKVSIKTVFSKLLGQTYLPADAVQMKKTLNLLMKLKDHVSFYIFYFDNFKDDAFCTSFNTLTNTNTDVR